ncbi:prefoldin subunit alpha [archaeon]|nr:prefoldin subunit alpha [archaeon]
MDEELNRKFRIYEQQIMQINEQLQAVEQATLDMGQINLGLDEIPKNKDSEILAPIGRGIFVKAKIVSEELTVDVGEGTFVKKTIPETKEIIIEQIEKLGMMKNDLENELEKINQEITQTMQEAQKNGNLELPTNSEEEHNSHEGHNHNHSHAHGKKCKCKECVDEDKCNCGHRH